MHQIFGTNIPYISSYGLLIMDLLHSYTKIRKVDAILKLDKFITTFLDISIQSPFITGYFSDKKFEKNKSHSTTYQGILSKSRRFWGLPPFSQNSEKFFDVLSSLIYYEFG